MAFWRRLLLRLHNFFRSARAERELARELDSRLVGGIAEGIRTALDDPRDGYAQRASELLAPWRREAVDAVVREQLLPRLVSRA